MQYLLMIHGDEAAMQQARKEDMAGMMAAYGAYTQAMKEAGVLRGGERLHPSSTATVVRDAERQDPGAQRPLCRSQGAARRLLRHRGARPRRGDRLGGALPRRAVRRDRGAADLGDVMTPSARRPRARPRRASRAKATASSSPFSPRASRDVAGAEDALVGRLRRRAAKPGRRSGVPAQPRGLARRRGAAADARRGAPPARRRGRRAARSRMIGEELASAEASDGPIPDRRLALMFACAHPAIDEAIRAPLMLQTILGLDAAAIASAFLVSPAAMGQRLARAKAKIRLAGVPFRIPEPEDWPERLGAVLEAIYAAFAHGWAEAFADDPRGRNLAEEAIWLGRVVVALAPRRAGGAGAARADALRRFAPRRAARRGGRYVPLSEQDLRLVEPRARSTRPRRCCAPRARCAGPGGFSSRRRSSRRTPRAPLAASRTGPPSPGSTTRSTR